MKPHDQGRFCQSCAKTVVDFTQMSDAEVVQWLTKNKHQGCGHFREDQLDRELYSPSGLKRKWALRTLMLGITAWLGLKPAEAQKPAKPAIPEIELIPSPSAAFPAVPLPPDSSTITGKVAAASGDYSKVIIRLNDTLEVKPNLFGHFRLSFSRKVPLERQWLVISAPGFNTQRYRLADLPLHQPLHLTLAVEPIIYPALRGRVGGMVASYKWYTPKGMHYKARSLFSHRF